jgi:hypothetical protein
MSQQQRWGGGGGAVEGIDVTAATVAEHEGRTR